MKSLGITWCDENNKFRTLFKTTLSLTYIMHEALHLLIRSGVPLAAR